MKKLVSVLLPTILCALAFPIFAADTTYNIPSGTEIVVQLQTTLSSKESKEGDTFEAKVAEPVFGHNTEVVPEGSFVRGHVTFIQEPGRVKGKAEMRLVLDSITTSDGVTYGVAAGLQDAKGAGDLKVTGDEGTIEGQGKSKKGAAEEAGVGAAAGAGAGAIAAGGTGALYGAGIGMVAGLIHNLHKRHKDILLSQGTELTFVISRDVDGKKGSPASPVFQTNTQ